MRIFERELYVKPFNPDGDVIVFGKSPEQEAADLKDGIARFGGEGRHPSYLMAYVHAARTLINNGVSNHSLDDIGLPAFYLQRHALELLIKRLLSWAVEYAEAIHSNKIPCEQVSKDLNGSHKLGRLFTHLVCICQHLDFSLPPESIGLLIDKIQSYELSETWARYDKSKNNTQHVETEISLPIVSLQCELEAVIHQILIGFNGSDSYEAELYNAWADANINVINT